MGLTAENSNAIALGLIGDEWNLAITRLAIMSGVRRYKDFRDQLGIANSVLTARLRRLTEAGVFTMAQYSDAPRRFEYVLTDRGTWLNFKNRGKLAILVQGDKRLFNQYGVIVVNQAKHPHVKKDLAQAFADWVLSRAGQETIASYKINGEQLFFPNAHE